MHFSLSRYVSMELCLLHCTRCVMHFSLSRYVSMRKFYSGVVAERATKNPENTTSYL